LSNILYKISLLAQNITKKLLTTINFNVILCFNLNGGIMGYEELQEQVNRYDDAVKARRKENYRYARDKGFTPREAMILAGKSKGEIDKIAKERDDGDGV
jgi:hypothetical protein